MRVAAAAVGVRRDRLHLGIDDVRVAGGDGDVDAAELIAGRRVDVGTPLPAFMFAPVAYGLPVTAVPKTNPFALRAIDVNAGHPLAGMVAR